MPLYDEKGQEGKKGRRQKKLGSYDEGRLYPRQMRHEISKIIGKIGKPSWQGCRLLQDRCWSKGFGLTARHDAAAIPTSDT